MHKQTRTAVLISLAALMVLSLTLSGCGAIGAAKQAVDIAKELATQVPQQLGATPTPATEPEAEATPTEAATELENTFDNLVKLAPVHMTSSYVYKKGETVQSSLSYEADLDANGNQRLTLQSNNDDPVEIYVVDGKMYIGMGEGQFMTMGDVEQDAGFSFLAVYGGAYLLAFNNLEEATLVGTEAVAPWQAKKYQVNMDLGTFGVAGLVSGVQGAEWQYQGFAWIETTKSALVKATVDWSGKSAGATETEGYHSEFLASQGTVTEITAPENVVSLGG